MAHIKKGKDGYYRTSLTIDGKRFPLIAKTLREIESKKAEIWKNYEKGRIVKTSTMTLEQYADQWFHSFQENRNPNTRDMYYYSIYKHINPHSGAFTRRGEEKFAKAISLLPSWLFVTLRHK